MASFQVNSYIWNESLGLIHVVPNSMGKVQGGILKTLQNVL